MDVPRLTHVRINVADLARSVAWYQELLGVSPQGWWPQQDPTYVHFTLGAAQLALGRYDPAPARGARVNLEVDDVDGWWTRTHGVVEVLEPLADTAYGSRKFTVLDPDGNEIGFIQATS